MSKKIADSIYKKIMTVFGDIKVFKWPMFVLYQPKGYKVTGKQIKEIQDRAKPGDILLRGYDNYLDGYFIPGEYFSHAGFYEGGFHQKVIHAMAESVKIDTLIDFCRCDYLAILRIKHTTPHDIYSAIRRANKYVGRPYDFYFDFNNPSDISCTELVSLVWGKRCGVVPKKIKILWGLISREVIIAEDYLFSNATEVIYMANKNPKDIKNIRGQKINEVL